MWELDVDAFRPGKVRLYSLPDFIPSHLALCVLSLPPSGRPLRYTQTG
jgi:hypothetical protein